MRSRGVLFAMLLLPGCNAILGLAEPTVLGVDGGTDSGHDAGRDAVHDASKDTTSRPPDAPREATAPDTASDTGHDATRAREAGSTDAVADVHETGPVDARADRAAETSTGGPVCGSGAGVATSCFATGDGLSNCGASGEDCCCASLPVPGGTYYRNYPNSTLSTGNPNANPATVTGYRLDKYEVTVGRFRSYLSYLTGVGGAPPDNGSGKHTYLNGGQGLVSVGATVPDGSTPTTTYETGWDGANWNANLPSGPGTMPAWETSFTTGCTGGQHTTWTSTPGANENLPVNCVSWYAAYAFCIWDGGFLPSEAEWELAAAGGSELRNYPWGSTSPGADNQYAIYGCNYPSGSSVCVDAGPGNVASVGSTVLGVGAYGQLDLGGNVFEFTLDTSESYVVPCVDCVNEVVDQFRIARGGGFAEAASLLVVPFRAETLSTPFYENGIRCARPPE